MGPALIGGQFLVTPVTFVERRVAQRYIGLEAGKGVLAQRVGCGDLGVDAAPGLGREAQTRNGEGGECRVTLTPEQGQVRAVVLLYGGHRQVPGAACRIEDGEPARALVPLIASDCPEAGVQGDPGHERGERCRRGAELAYVSVQPPLQQELERLAGSFAPPQARCLTGQLPRLLGECGRSDARAGQAHPARRFGYREAGLVSAAERLEARPQQFAATDGIELSVLAEPVLHLGQ